MKDYEKADFRPINAHLVALKDAKKNITVEEKKVFFSSCFWSLWTILKIT